MAKFAFSSITLRVGAPGVTPLTDADDVGAIQNASLEVPSEFAEVREAAHVNLFPIARGEHSSDVNFSCDTVDALNARILEYAGGATVSAAGGFDVFTWSAGSTNKPKLCRIEGFGKAIDEETGVEHDIDFKIPRAKFNGVNLPFNRTEFAQQSLTAKSYPTRGTGTDTDIALQLRKDQ